MTTTLEEHRGYIADAVRLQHFRDAISATIQPGDLVADLGCGFAVLGLMCLRAGAAQVWGIDDTEAIEIAREAAARAGFSERYQCLRERSGRAELPTRVDVLICDHVGYMGIDYGILDMVADARRRMLKPGGRIVPSCIRLVAAGVASRRCRAKADEWVGADIPEDYHWLAGYGHNTKHPLSLAADEIACAPELLATFDLYQDAPDLCSGEVEFVMPSSGAMDGLAVWFDCDLGPGVTMTNSPLSPHRIDRDQAFLPFAQPLEFAADDRIGVNIAIRPNDNIVSWSALNRRSGARCRQSTLQAKILAPGVLSGGASHVPAFGKRGRLVKAVTEAIDGVSTAREIADRIVAANTGLLPSEAELRAAVLAELARIER